MDSTLAYEDAYRPAPHELKLRPTSCVGCRNHNVKPTYGGFAVDKCTRSAKHSLVEFAVKSSGHCGPARRNYTK